MKTIRRLLETGFGVPIILAVLSLALGTYGFDQLNRMATWTWWDSLYSGLTMFALGAQPPAGSRDWPMTLQVARFVAAVSVGWTAVVAVMRAVSHEWRRLRVPMLRKHVIVVGSGESAFHLRSLMPEKSIHVALDPAVRAPAVEHTAGAVIIHAASLDTSTMASAAVHRAAHIFIATGRDATNRVIASEVRDYVAASGHAHSLTCHLELPRAERSLLRSPASLRALRAAGFEVRVFDLSRVAARAIMRTHPPHAGRLPFDGDPPLHVLIVGFGEIGEALTKQVLRTCHYCDRKRVKLTVVDNGNLASWERFRAETPGLDLVADVSFVNEAPSSITNDKWDVFQVAGAFDAAYIATADIEAAYVLAADASTGLGSKIAPCPLVVCVPGVSEAQLGLAQSGVSVFDPASAWTKESLLDDALDMAAKREHERYLKDRDAARVIGAVRKAAEHPWDEIPEWIRDKNRDRIDFDPVVDAIVRLTPLVIAGESASSESVELLAEIEHRRWMAGAVLAGFQFGEPRDEERKFLHENLVSYDLLPDQTKEYDRQAMRDTLARLANKAPASTTD